MKQNNRVNKQKVSFQWKKEPVEKNVTPIKSKQVEKKRKEYSRVKFSTKVKLSKKDVKCIKETLYLTNRARHLTIAKVNSDPSISLADLKNYILGKLMKEKSTFSHATVDIISNSIFRVRNSIINNIKSDDIGNTKSIPFRESSLVNNRFTVNYRRNMIFFEDIGVTVELEEPLPRIQEDSTFYLNLFVDDLIDVNHVFVSFYYKPAVIMKKEQTSKSEQVGGA